MYTGRFFSNQTCYLNNSVNVKLYRTRIFNNETNFGFIPRVRQLVQLKRKLFDWSMIDAVADAMTWCCHLCVLHRTYCGRPFQIVLIPFLEILIAPEAFRVDQFPWSQFPINSKHSRLPLNPMSTVLHCNYKIEHMSVDQRTKLENLFPRLGMTASLRSKGPSQIRSSLCTRAPTPIVLLKPSMACIANSRTMAKAEKKPFVVKIMDLVGKEKPDTKTSVVHSNEVNGGMHASSVKPYLQQVALMHSVYQGKSDRLPGHAKGSRGGLKVIGRPLPPAPQMPRMLVSHARNFSQDSTASMEATCAKCRKRVIEEKPSWERSVRTKMHMTEEEKLFVEATAALSDKNVDTEEDEKAKSQAQ